MDCWNEAVEGLEEKGTKVNEQQPVTSIMSQEHFNQICSMPVKLINIKICAIGTDHDKYPELVEKEDLVQLYQIKSRK